MHFCIASYTIAGMNRPQTPETISVEEAARRLGLAPRSVYERIEKGILPARRFGKKGWAILASDVAAQPDPVIDRSQRRRGLQRLVPPPNGAPDRPNQPAS